uniref:Uncharacterized protein n=1 Tax=Rhizophora mucronata TaxID=61149 RepID=A0A2P2PAN2_RHIMU
MLQYFMKVVDVFWLSEQLFYFYKFMCQYLV